MFWQGRRESDNVEDRRGVSGKGIAAGGGLIAVVVIVAKLLFGGGITSQDLQSLMPGQQGAQTELSPQQKTQQDERAHFVKVVLADIEDVWVEIFSKSGETYPKPTLVLFSGATQSGCGTADSQTGPFYCPGDQKLYIALAFYSEMRERFGATAGDFAQAYVIAHEIGHHIQNLMGTAGKVDNLRGQLSEADYNKYSVCLELQADFYAGVWGHYMQGKGYIEKGDIEDALNAANVIGDDHLQKQAQGYVTPESFTHGTSEQRMFWFKKGFDSGDLSQGDTFKTYGLRL